MDATGSSAFANATPVQAQRSERRPTRMRGHILAADGTHHEIHLANLSYEGCGIETATALLPGQQVKLSVLGRGGIDSEVRWCRDGKAGLVFLPPKPEPNARRPRKSAGRMDVLAESEDTGSGLDDGRVERFLESVWQKTQLASAEVHCLMNLAMAATYDPDPEAPNGFRLPYDLETGELIAERWRRWLRHDPVHMVARHAASLRKLLGIYIDCGWRDQYHIHYGSRILSKRLAQAGIRHTYEEFDDNHSDIDYRMDVSLPFLYRSLKP